MRWQVLVVIATLGLLTTANVHADIVSFSTDPNLASEWTFSNLYDGGTPDGCANTTATWNAGNENLDMASVNEEGLKLLVKNGTTRTATDTVTMEVSNYVSDVATAGGWAVCGLMISSVQSPALFDANPQYEFAIEANPTDGLHCALSIGGGSAMQLGIAKYVITSMPSVMKLDIAYDSNSSELVFLLNDSEIARDSSYPSDQLPYYGIYWGGGAATTTSASVDNFGIVPVPEPSTLALLTSVLLGMLCCNRRKRA